MNRINHSLLLCSEPQQDTLSLSDERQGESDPPTKPRFETELHIPTHAATKENRSLQPNPKGRILFSFHNPSVPNSPQLQRRELNTSILEAKRQREDKLTRMEKRKRRRLRHWGSRSPDTGETGGGKGFDREREKKRDFLSLFRLYT